MNILKNKKIDKQYFYEAHLNIKSLVKLGIPKLMGSNVLIQKMSHPIYEILFIMKVNFNSFSKIFYHITNVLSPLLTFM